MKRKIEAKLKNRTEPSDASFAQELAVTIMNKADATPNQSPTVQSPEAAKETYATTANEPASNLLIRVSDNLLNPATREPQSTSSPSADSIENPLVSLISLSTSSNSPTFPPPRNEDLKIEGLGHESDEEGRLVVQVEEQRLAEEQARERRRRLEQRLAAARRQQSRSPIKGREERSERPHGSISYLCQGRH